MTKIPHDSHRKILDETAKSIRELVLQLEKSEIEGRPITAADIQTIAGRLQSHVEDLLVASRSMRE
jgi:hypothetical protein